MIPEYKLYRASSGLMFFHFLSILLLLSQLVGGFHFGGSFPLRGGVGSFVVTHISSDVNVCSPWTTRQFGARTSRRARSLTVNGAFQNEYQTFFNDASRLGQAFISSLSPEERAKRAYEVQLAWTLPCINQVPSTVYCRIIPEVPADVCETDVVLVATALTEQKYAFVYVPKSCTAFIPLQVGAKRTGLEIAGDWTCVREYASENGEQLENDIIDIAILLRRKADAMVAETGGVNFDVIRPMIDEISALKSKYRVVVGAALPEESSGEDETPGDN